MVPKRIMLVAGETSGDILAAELVQALRIELAQAEADFSDYHQPLHASLEPVFFGAGGPHMRAAGVELAFDMSGHAVTGLSDVIEKLSFFRRRMKELIRLAEQRQPHAIICVDFSGFNLRLVCALRRRIRTKRRAFYNWNPKVIQYVSPQVWASRAGRARHLERNVDLLLSILPFEKEWYARHAPRLKVEFVGHPIVDRCAKSATAKTRPETEVVLLLPGSRAGEIRRHVPVMAEAAGLIVRKHSSKFRMVLPDESLAGMARQVVPGTIDVRVGGLAEALNAATMAIASTGTVTMECACFGVPTVAIYKTSWVTYQVARRIVRVKYLAMPNILAREVIYPEFIQNDATPENIAREALDLLHNEAHRKQIKEKLAVVIESLGKPGASRRAAQAVIKVVWENYPISTSTALSEA